MSFLHSPAVSYGTLVLAIVAGLYAFVRSFSRNGVHPDFLVALAVVNLMAILSFRPLSAFIAAAVCGLLCYEGGKNPWWRGANACLWILAALWLFAAARGGYVLRRGYFPDYAAVNLVVKPLLAMLAGVSAAVIQLLFRAGAMEHRMLSRDVPFAPARVCVHCQGAIDTDSVFCTHCGQRQQR